MPVLQDLLIEDDADLFKLRALCGLAWLRGLRVEV